MSERTIFHIDKKAPALATGEIMIDASADQVWEVLTTFADWPSWNPDVKSVLSQRGQGGVAPGSVFRWKASGMNVTSTVQIVQPPRLIGWTGRMIAVGAVHTWQLSDQGGKTLVRTEESWDGLLVSIFRVPLRRMLKRSLDSGLGHLKAEAERRARG